MAPAAIETQSRRLANRYELQTPLGSGGMGTVFRAYDWLTGELVALKRLQVARWLPMAAEPRLALAQEFQALAALRHPHIVTVRDYGFDEARQPFFTMELLPYARPLTVAAELLPDEQRLDLLLQLLETLIYLHRGGIIHRDLKPGNVLVDARGALKLLDFGLAALPGQAFLPGGTPAYMAPELRRGAAATPASDLYAVGLLALELLAGWPPPLNGTGVELTAALLAHLPLNKSWQALLARLLAPDPADRLADAAEALAACCHAAGRPLPPERPETRDSFLQAAPFTGRSAELHHLDQARRAAVDGRAEGWLLLAESGLGKSRLSQELRTRALVDGMVVLSGQAQPDGSPYHLWQPILRALLLQLSLSELEAGVVQSILPDTGRLLGRPIPTPPVLPPERTRARLHLTLLALLRRLAQQQPLFLLLEDLHEVDGASLSLLQALAAQLPLPGLFLLGTGRPEERPALPAELPGLRLLQLAPLSAAAVAALSQAMLGAVGRAPELLAFLERETEGNTFFLVEVVRLLAEEAERLDQILAQPLPHSLFPAGIRVIVERRLSRLPARLVQLLQKAALAGRQLDLALLARLAPWSAEVDWLTRCAQAGVVDRPVGSPTWQFSHDKIREGLLRQGDATRQRRWHDQIGRALELIYQADLAPHAPALVHHFAAAGRPGKQRLYLLLAARHAESSYAHESAISYYEQALQQTSPAAAQARLHLDLARVCRNSSQWEAAENHLQAAVRLARGPFAPIWLQLGSLARLRARYQDALAWLARAQASYRRAGDGAGLCQTLVDMANVYYQQGDYVLARDCLEPAATHAANPSQQALVQHNLGSVAYAQGDYAAAQNYFATALQRRLVDAHPVELADSYNNLGLVAFRQGAWEQAQQCFAASLTLRRQAGDHSGIAAALSNLGLIPYQRREYTLARQYWAEALQLRRQLSEQRGLAATLDNLALIAVAQAEPERAQALIAEAIALRQQLGDQQGLVNSYSNRARLALQLGDLAAARADYRASLTLAAAIGDQLGLVFGLAGIAAVCVGNGQLAAAAELLAGAASQMAQLGGTWEEDEGALFTSTRQQCEAGLPPALFAQAWAAGATQTMDDLMHLTAGKA